MENVLWLAGRGYFAIKISAIKSFSYRVILSSFFSLKQRTSLDLLTLAFDEPKLSLTTLKNFVHEYSIPCVPIFLLYYKNDRRFPSKFCTHLRRLSRFSKYILCLSKIHQKLPSVDPYIQDIQGCWTPAVSEGQKEWWKRRIRARGGMSINWASKYLLV